MAESLIPRRLLMNDHDDFEVSMEGYKSMIKDSPDGEWDEFPFNDEFWTLVAPLKAGPSLIGQVDEISGEGGKLTPAKITRAEAKVLAEYYLMELNGIHLEETMQGGGTSSTGMRMKVYANKRINDLVESGAVTEELFSEMANRILENY
jgi:hypothetical protein